MYSSKCLKIKMKILFIYNIMMQLVLNATTNKFVHVIVHINNFSYTSSNFSDRWLSHASLRVRVVCAQDMSARAPSTGDTNPRAGRKSPCYLLQRVLHSGRAMVRRRHVVEASSSLALR